MLAATETYAIEDFDDTPVSSDEALFPDLDPGYYDTLTGRWHKPTSPTEERVYKTVCHERILKYFTTGLSDLELEFHPNGDLWSFLVVEKPQLTTRVEWAVQIAEGLAQLHSNSIVWSDAHFRNVLVTQDLNIVLCDFAFSVFNPQIYHDFTTAPPPIFIAPWGYFGLPPTYVDIFGFGVMLFALLANRFPWTDDLLPNMDAQTEAMAKHGRREFDTLEAFPDLNAHFGEVVTKCFQATYLTGTELLHDLKCARDGWLQSQGPN
ncbi:Protein kinase domain-containing protein [Mycena sanguinolenta]|uniref:Protein kinase domain-containing protein n=1 Tax=Mycena sanguinolenta TaxID=230812 RepID=A0A8H6X643_9AGAR|nr:Protein kinase domain-containing protein [Mycena sanguinolenta]